MFALLLFGNRLSGQSENLQLKFNPGEKLTLDIYYNWGFVWVNAGSVYFKTDTVSQSGIQLFHFTSFGRSLDSWDWFLKVRDFYEAYSVTDNLNPVFSQRKILEGTKVIYNKYKFDYKKSRIYADLYYSDSGTIIDTLILKSQTFDPLTAIYYARSVDFSNAVVNQKYPFNIVIDEKVYDLYIRYLGKETISDRNDNKYKCIKFSAKMVEGTIFSGGEDIIVWVSDDKNKVPVLVEANIIVGSIKAYIQKTENLKYPFDSKVTSE